MFAFTPESPEDTAAIETLLDRAFGPDRLNKTSYRFRQGVEPIRTLGLTARIGSQIVGTIRYWPIAIEADWPADTRPALLLGPLAIEPARRGKGIGIELMERSLSHAAALGHPLAVLVGDLAYYRRVGFVASTSHGIFMPDEAPERLLVRELKPGALSAVQGGVRALSSRAGLSGLRASTPI